MSEDKYKVLIVHNYYQIPGGEDTVVANEKKLLEDYGHEVILYSRNNSELKEMGKLKKLLLPITTIFNPRTYREVRKIIKENNVDIVHVHNTLNLISPSVYYAALSLKVPVVQTVHNFRLLCPGATFYRDGHICEDCVSHGLKCAVKYSCYRDSKIQTLVCVISTKIHRMTGVYGKIKYICLTDFNKEKLLQLKQIKTDQVYVKPNFTYETVIVKEQEEYYLFIGRIEEIKGIPLLIDAFERIPKRKLVIAGTGSDYKKYLSYVKSHHINNIEFKGFLKREELSLVLEKAKAVIVSSQWYEPFGMIVIEAFAARTPVIVGDIGNVGNLVEDGIDGVKFKYDSADELIAAIKKFETLDVKKLGDNAYQKFVEKFSQMENYKAFKLIYQAITV